MKSSYILVLITAQDKKEADKISQALLKNKLAACVNLVPKVESFFWGEGKIERAQEALLFVKTKKEKFAALKKLVKSLHSYTVPEIIALTLSAGLKSYFNWLDDCLS